MARPVLERAVKEEWVLKYFLRLAAVLRPNRPVLLPLQVWVMPWEGLEVALAADSLQARPRTLRSGKALPKVV